MENEVILIGSHDTMSYLPPKNPLMYLGGLLVARCQSNDIEKQFDNGARVFDLRIYYDENGKKYKDGYIEHWFFAHGSCKFKGKGLRDILNILDNKSRSTNETIYVRVIYERGNHQTEFAEICEYMEDIYHNCNKGRLVFFGGNQKKGWNRLYKFNNIYCKDYSTKFAGFPDTLNNQWVSSMADDARWYERIIPCLYAKRMNKINLTKAKYLVNLYDFL